jgi:MoaA/NifB/PqqE/SkfB family radical SAM enzyme
VSELAILYRGPLSSCNYACDYCPFAKRVESRAELDRDRACLARFVGWVLAREAAATSVFFTPWGEALVRPWYRDAFAALSHHPAVRRVAAQTNLSMRLDFLDRCDAAKVGLWCTYHPGEVDRARFVAQVGEAIARGATVSAGVVGLREHLDEITALRAELPGDVYLWVNAWQRSLGYYTPDEVARVEAIDPLFRLNLRGHRSLGEPCHAGHIVVSVDGDGVVRRCHFLAAPLGNLYEGALDGLTTEPSPCTAPSCRCHIGYVHLDRLGLGEVFGEGILERVPRRDLDTAALLAAGRTRW